MDEILPTALFSLICLISYFLEWEDLRGIDSKFYWQYGEKKMNKNMLYTTKNYAITPGIFEIFLGVNFNIFFTKK
jgi:hypothetical protein